MQFQSSERKASNEHEKENNNSYGIVLSILTYWREYLTFWTDFALP